MEFESKRQRVGPVEARWCGGGGLVLLVVLVELGFGGIGFSGFITD
jgi:hypothetical protein